ncbi:MAG: YggS family pyridoxal phosphate-dependent enzyme [Bacteroidia bacterium]|nr:YggS family pyridoxal phosphate-dependent enzyme [Bacteroidia bacterium]
MDIKENINALKISLPQYLKLVLVTKTQPDEKILEAYNAGQKIFGENKVQELITKASRLPKDIEWHFIGHLQSNKVKYIAPFVSMIHSVDSLKLLQIINKEALRNNRIVDCLFQMYIAQEETKFGLTLDEIVTIITSSELKELKNIRMKGLMGMASFTENKEQVRSELRFLADTFKKLKEKYYHDDDNFKELSMGMSDDYTIAIEEGSTIARIGTLIFGERM